MQFGSLSGSALNIGIAIVLEDKFSNPAADINRQIKQLQNDAKAAVYDNLSAAQGIFSNISNGFFEIARGMGTAIADSYEFIDTMTTVGAITEATQSQMKALENTALDLGYQTILTSKDIASGMKYLAMAGNDAKKIQALIESASYMGIAGGLSVGGKGGAADMLTNIMYMYGLNPETEASSISDQITKATLAANISMEDLANSLRYAGGDMHSFGLSVAETSAMIGVLGNNGIQASMAGTALGNMMRYLTRSITKKGTDGYKYLTQMGLSEEDFFDAQGNLQDMGYILTKLGDAWVRLSEKEQSLFGNAIFGVRGLRAGKALMSNYQDYLNLLKEIENSEGYAKSISEKRMNSLAGSLEQMTSAWESVQIAFAKSLEPVLVPILKMISNILGVVQNILQSPWGTFISVIAGLLVIIGGIVTKSLQWVATFKILTMTGTVNFTNLFNILFSGWGRATAAAANYAAIQEYINTLAATGNVTNAMQVASSKLPPGTWIGSGLYKGKGNTWWVPDASSVTGKKRVSAAAAQKILEQDKKGLASAIAGNTAAVGKGTGALGKVTGVLGKVTGVLGWIGAIVGVFSILGTLHSDIQENSDEIKKNTAAANTLASQHELDRQRKESRQWLTPEGEMIMFTNALDQFTQAINRFDQSKVNINLNVPPSDKRKWADINPNMKTNTNGA